MDDPDREKEIAVLRQQLSTLEAKRAALAEECVHFAARIHETRKEFGNPFCYSHPAEPDEGIANYNPNYARSKTPSDFLRVDRDLARIKEQLRSS